MRKFRQSPKAPTSPEDDVVTGDQESGYDRLITALTNSKIAAENNALYQTIYQLIKKSRQVEQGTNSKLSSISAAVTNLTVTGPGGGGGVVVPPVVVSNYYDAPLTDGHLDETNLIFANGECVIVQVPND